VPGTPVRSATSAIRIVLMTITVKLQPHSKVKRFFENLAALIMTMTGGNALYCRDDARPKFPMSATTSGAS
jgi:hypothetical protein